jgi:hypothetical protein
MGVPATGVSVADASSVAVVGASVDFVTGPALTGVGVAPHAFKVIEHKNKRVNIFFMAFSGCDYSVNISR